MRMDEGSFDQKLSLDLTPLIDVVFLLVLFFAVSTSFISAEDLDNLKFKATSLSELVEHLKSEKSLVEKKYRDETRQLSSSLEVSAEKLTSTQSELKKSTEQLAQSNQELVVLMQTSQQLNSSKQTLESELQNLKTSEQQLKLELIEQQEKFASLSDQSELVLKSSALSEEKLAALDLENTSMRGEILSIKETLSAERDKVKLELDTLKEELAEQQNKNKSLMLENNNTADQLGALRQQFNKDIESYSQKNSELNEELKKFRALSDLDQAQIEKIVRAQKQLSNGLSEYLAENKLSVKREQEQIILQLQDQILFSSGQADLKQQGLDVLRDVGKLLAEPSEGIQIQIAGHTDNVPLSDGNRYGDNWGLSAARAANVVRFFEKELNIDATKMSAVGFGEHRPVGDNTTNAGRARNRRIEIVLLPN